MLYVAVLYVTKTYVVKLHITIRHGQRVEEVFIFVVDRIVFSL